MKRFIQQHWALTEAQTPPLLWVLLVVICIVAGAVVDIGSYLDHRRGITDKAFCVILNADPPPAGTPAATVQAYDEAYRLERCHPTPQATPTKPPASRPVGTSTRSPRPTATKTVAVPGPVRLEPGPTTTATTKPRIIFRSPSPSSAPPPSRAPPTPAPTPTCAVPLLGICLAKSPLPL